MPETIVVASLVTQVLTLIAGCFLLLQLFRQQGRILLRLDALESKTAGLSDNAGSGSDLTGLAVETAVEDFQLPDVTGKKVSLSDFRGRRVLLIYWSPECGFCDMAAAELARMQSRLEKNKTQIVMVSFGNAESNRKLAAEHELSSTILLLENSPAQKFLADEVFQYCGTPSAYLLDEQGRVARSLTSGMDQVVLLAREAAAETQPDKAEAKKGTIRRLPLSESRIEREGLKAGTPAPHFSLPAIDGETVSLEQYRGRKVLLVFTDPQCGPCDDLAPHLVGLHRKHGNNGLALVMVGRGNAEQNQKKAKEHGISFPLVLQERWKLSREYGIFTTPVAFLIGKDGIIMRNVAIGPDQILTLAREGLAPR